jgi:hypothetical protein
MKEIETLNNYVNKYYNSNLQDGNELNFYCKKFQDYLPFVVTLRAGYAQRIWNYGLWLSETKN